MKKPTLKLPMNTFQVVLEVAGTLVLIIFTTYLITNYSKLPTEIPTHFNIKGEPNSWGDKSEILTLYVVGVLLYIGLTVLNRFPHIFNYPVKITEQNAEVQYRMAQILLSVMKLVTLAIFLYISIHMIKVAEGIHPAIGNVFIILILCCSLIPVIVYLILAYKAK